MPGITSSLLIATYNWPDALGLVLSSAEEPSADVDERKSDPLTKATRRRPSARSSSMNACGVRLE